MRRQYLGLAVIAAFGAIAASAQSAVSHADERADPIFVYDDLDRFGEAIRKVDGGAPPEATFADYMKAGSAAYPGYIARYDVTAASIAKAVAESPKHYRKVATLKPYLKQQEATIRRGMERLIALVPGENASPPIYFLVGNMHAGGIQVALEPPLGQHRQGLVLLLEALSMAPDTDMSEWPGTYSGGYLEDIPYVAVHESMHVYQMQAMGRENYVSIYSSGNPNNIYLALAVREGCADYLTYLALGKRRRGNQQSYGEANERELWRQFQAVMYKPASFGDGWFGALDPKTPDWPPQIGYWLGSRMCQAYHEAAPDRDAAIRHIMNAYSVEHMRPIADAYTRKMGS